jgi:nucleoside-diphosphate-sugar epimerase
MTETQKTRVFVTGANGFIGKHLTNKLKKNFDVTVLDERLENISIWKNKLSNMDVVIHLAAVTHSKNVSDYEKINFLGTKNLIKVSECFCVKQFIFISSRTIGVCCGSYGASKMEAEEVLKKSSIPYTILRLGEVYDENLNDKAVLGSLSRITNILPIIPYIKSEDIKFCPIHILDVIDGIISCIKNPLSINNTYVLAGPENMSFQDLLKKICLIKKRKRVFIPIPVFLAKILFFVVHKVFRLAYPDQLDRLLCKKDGMSENVWNDLKIKPRNFLGEISKPSLLTHQKENLNV